MKTLKELFEGLLGGEVNSEDFKKSVELIAEQNPYLLMQQTKELLDDYQTILPTLQSLFLGLATQNLQDEQALKKWFDNFSKNNKI